MSTIRVREMWAVAAAGLVAGTATAQYEPFTEEAVARGAIYQVFDYPLPYGYLGVGVGFADLDTDGDPDIVVIGRTDGAIGLFENDGDGQFFDRSLGCGIPPVPGQVGLPSSGGSAFAAADYDGDGDLDLYFTRLGMPNTLVRNEGGFFFTDVTVAAGVGDAGAGKGASWGDYDGDGWLDLYVCNYNGIVQGTDDMDNVLYRNRGDGTFEDVSVAQTVNDHGFGFQAVWFDYDRDGDVDLYLSNDRGHLPPLFRSNQLWRNDDGQLVNVSVGSGADLGLFSMGVACGDFDNNRWPDLYTTNIGGYDDGFNPLFLNQGDGTFLESSAKAAVDQYITSWGAIFFDFDNSGRQELYVNNMFLPNTFYACESGFPCQNVAAQVGLEGVPWNGSNVGVSFCSSVADIDDDGDLDLIENNLGANLQLYLNHEGQDHSWIKYRVVGEHPNLFAVGAGLDTRLGDDWQWREILAGGNGYLGQNELTVHVGLGTALKVDEVVVTWPGGSPTRTLTDLPGNETWTIYPPARLGDADGDGQRLLDDYLVLAGCFGGVVAPGCEMMDYDGDSVIDGDDAAAFLAGYDAPLLDCDGDGTPDLEAILLDGGLDPNANGIPDACEASGDVDGDGAVGVGDLTVVVLNWGACGSPCFGDANGDGTVGVSDLTTVIVGWD